MIKQLDLKDAPEGERPSRSQLTRLISGDGVMLSLTGVVFWAKLLYRVTDDMVGIVTDPVPGTNALPTGINGGDLISFELKHVHQVFPDKNREHVDLHLLVTSAKADNPFVFRTKWPRVLAKVHLGNTVTASAAMWIDPASDNKQENEVINDIVNWYFYNYLNKKK